MKSFSMPSPQEMEALINFCKIMATAPFYAKLGPGGVMAIYMTAREYDLPLMACLNGGLHTFDGKVTFSAIMIDALILKAGHKTDLLHLDEKSCTIKFTRIERKLDKDYQPLQYTYTMDQAARAGYLSKTNWKTSPKDMLYSRCLTGGGRKHMPEVFVGVMVAGEMVGTEADSHVEPLLPANVQTTVLVPVSTNLVEKPVQNAEISYEPAQGYEEFCKKHGINEQGPKCEYVQSVCEKTGKDKVHIVNCALSNEPKFLEMFDKWEKEGIKTKQREAEQKEKEQNQSLAEGIKWLADAVKTMPSPV